MITQKVIDRFNRYYTIDKETGCWNWDRVVLDNGYGQVYIPNVGGRGSHRVSYLITHGEIKDGMHILHKCHNRRCCNPDHLYEGTPQQNMMDKVRNGTQTKGSDVVFSKLTETKVLDIMKREHQPEVYAVKYGVRTSSIYNIWSRKTWKHVHL